MRIILQLFEYARGKVFCVLAMGLGAVLPASAWDFYGLMDTNSTRGNIYGTMTLTFSYTNPDDWTPSQGNPSSGTWSSAIELVETCTNAGFEEVTLDFNAYEESPNELYVLGDIVLTLPGYGTVSSGAIGGPGGFFQPNQSGGGTSSGSAMGTIFDASGQYLIRYDLGFSLKMPWDGTASDSEGSWWAIYTITPVPEPSTAAIVLAGAGGLLWKFRSCRKDKMGHTRCPE